MSTTMTGHAADTLIGRAGQNRVVPMMEGLIEARSCFVIHEYHEYLVCFWFTRLKHVGRKH